MSSPPAPNGNRPPETGLVAIIGLGCVLPDANSPAEFWQNLRAGKSSIREVPHERWDPALYHSEDRAAPDKTYSKIGAFVTGFRPDPVRFRIPPKVLESLDDSQLWALEAARQAFADAGYDAKPFDRTRCAVILGNAMGGETRGATTLRVEFPYVRKSLTDTASFRRLPAAEQQRLLAEMETGYKGSLPEITEDTMPGELSNVISGRIANVFNLSGKNFTTDAACASSLAAMDAACKALHYREADLVVTGGADRSMDVSTYVKFSKIGALSAHGSFPFDARADGFVMGEGCAMMLLKRLEDAQRDGDKIYAVIRGVGSSSDGKGKGITAPNLEGQLKCIARALEDAQTPTGELDLIECHGTSTKVGDVVEIEGLTKILGPHVSRDQSIPIGSVKSNIGHLKSAAGAASLLKVVLALQEKTLPPSINFETPNPNIAWSHAPFHVITRASPWPEPPGGRPRRAGISSFGFGGTNFHLIVEEHAPGKNVAKAGAQTAPVAAAAAGPAPAGVTGVLLRATPRHRTAEPLHAQAMTDVLVVGGASGEAVAAEVRRLREALKDRVTERTLPAFFHAHNAAAVVEPVRIACVVESPPHAVEQLGAALEGLEEPKKRALLAHRGIHFGEGRVSGRLAFLFPGQGSQYADMIRDLASRYETVRRTLDEADRVMEPLVGKPLTAFLFSDPARGVGKDQVEEALKRTEITQPAVLAVDAALCRLLADYGVKPDLLAGHSLGEYGALVASGVLTFEDALTAVSARGREMASVKVPDLGKMASVTADLATVEAKLKAIPGYVIPANKNCKVQTVIAGASPAVDQAVALFQSEGIQAQLIPVSAAFHSAIVAPAQEPMGRVIERLDVGEPKIPVLSNVHADYYPRGAGARGQVVDLLRRQVASPVEWQRQIERMHADGARAFVEVGPKAVLTTFVRNILEGRPHAALATNHPKKGGFFHFHDVIAFLAASGYPVRFPRPDDPAVHLAGYRERLEALPATPKAFPAARVAAPPVAVPPSDLGRAADDFIREKQEELRRVLEAQMRSPAPPASADLELIALQNRVVALGLNLEPVLITGVSVGTPGTFKKLFDDANFDRVFAGENAIEPLTDEERRKQVEKNVRRLVKSATGDHRFEAIRDVAEVIKLAGKKGRFDFEKDYGVNADFADALDITSKMAIAAGVEALRDAQIPLVRGYVKTSTGRFLPGEWALPEPLQAETGVIFCSVWPGVPKIIDYVSQNLANQYARRSADERRALYRELAGRVRDTETRAELEAWCARHEAEVEQGTKLHEFNRRFLFHVLAMGHSQLAQFIRAKGPNAHVEAACATTTEAIGIAEDWIRTGRCKRVLIVGADDITGPEMIEYWTAGFLAAGAATTEGDVTKAALPFDKRRHGMIIGMGAVGLVVEAESVVKARGMEGITEILATTFLNSAYHGSRLDTEHVAMVMDDLLTVVERRTGLPRARIAERLLFMSHETYTPARGGSAAAEIEALQKTFGAHVSKVVVANTKGFTGHPMAVGIEDAIAIRSLQMGRVPPIANLREPDPDLGAIQLSRGGFHDLEYGLRLGAGFGSQIAMYVMRLRSRDPKRILDPARYHAWLQRVSGTKNPEVEVVHRTLRVKASLPALAPTPTPAPVAPAAPPSLPAPVPGPTPRPPPVPVPSIAARPPSHAEALARLVDLVAEKTGYAKDLLEPDLELEADLGIDTVKQAELFGLVRESYGLPRDDTLQLKDYPTLNKIAGYLASRSLAGPVPARAAAPSPSLAPAPGPVGAPQPLPRDQVLNRLLEIVTEKTGYPRDLLEPDLELEADLGIDTVKQAEIFGLVRDELHLPRDDALQLKDHPTLNKIVDYLYGRAAGRAPVATAAPPSLASSAGPPAAAPAPAPEPARATTTGPVDPAGALERIRQIVAEKTGYPLDLLDPNLELEADLGIDTVKQAELFGLVRETFGIPRRDDVQLKDYSTLSKIADFIVESARGGPPVARAAPMPAATAPAPPPAAFVSPPGPSSSAMEAAPTTPSGGARSGADDVLDHVRRVVAERTGYPPDLLDANLDLEADLGIDTVKQAELFGLVREHYGIPRRDDLQLKDYNTLAKIAQFIATGVDAKPAASAGPAAVANGPTAVQTTLPTAEPATPRTSRRYVVRYVTAPAPAPAAGRLRGKVLVIAAPLDARAALVRALASAGARGLTLDAPPGTLKEAQEWVDAQRRKNPRLNGLVYVTEPETPGTGFSLEQARTPKAVFHLVKALLNGAQSGDVEFVAAATRLGGDFAAYAAQPFNPIDGGVVGLLKAVARELPGATVKSVDFAARATPEAVAATLVKEMERPDGLVEVGTFGGRGTLRLLEQETAEEEPGIELGARDVVLVSGGGTGITSDVVRRLAAPGRATAFVLLGRTPLDPDASRFAAFRTRDWNGKRVEIQAELKARGERVTPVTVERALTSLRKSAEVHVTLEALRAAGARAEYHSVDVTNADAMRSLVADVRGRLGPVTAIVHAAGLEESKLIVDKTSESFDRVYDVKVLGAASLLAATRDDPLRSFVCFTSIAGRFGNAGQADYSAANDALAKLCAALRVERGRDFPATAIDWSAWAGKGMATRGSIMAVLQEAGVVAIPLQEGVERFAQELAHGLRDAEVVIAGSLGPFAAPGAFARREDVLVVPPLAGFPRPTPTPGPRRGGQVVVLETPAPTAGGNLLTKEITSDGRSATATLVLDPARDPYLQDHRVDGVPYLPGVFGAEAFAEVAARVAPAGFRFAGAHDVEFRLPVKVVRDRPLEVTVVASVATESPDSVEVGCRLQSVFVNAKGERLGAPRIHFTGTLVFARTAPTAAARPEPTADVERVIPQAEIYRHYFHGPSFRVLNQVGPLADGRTTVGIWADPRAPVFRDRTPRFLTSPLLNELAYQTAGAHELFRNRWLSLPKGVGRLIHYREAPEGAAVRAVAAFKELLDNVASFDVAVATTDGDLLFELRDFQLIRLRPLEAPNGGPATEAAPSPPGFPQDAPRVYKARWGRDVPLPQAGAVGVVVDQREVEAAGVTPEESLTHGERLDQASFRNEKRAREFFAGRLAAKEALATLLGRPIREARGIEIRRLATGEPQARGAGLEDALVSITHTGNAAFAAAALRTHTVHTLGVDAERIEAKPTAFETEAFTESERRLIDRLERSGAARPDLQVRFWAVKEAVLKALGKGFALDLHHVRIAGLDANERATVDLAEPARAILDGLGAHHVRVQTWLRDGLAFALAWTHP